MNDERDEQNEFELNVTFQEKKDDENIFFWFFSNSIQSSKHSTSRQFFK